MYLCAFFRDLHGHAYLRINGIVLLSLTAQSLDARVMLRSSQVVLVYSLATLQWSSIAKCLKLREH